VSRGLAESELSAIEATFGFRFPVDLRALLAAGPTTSQYDIATRSGSRPSRVEDRLELLSAAPVLIPIGGSRYMPYTNWPG
jgi:hypothetical protein